MKPEEDLVSLQVFIPRWMREGFKDICTAHRLTQREVLIDFVREVCRSAGVSEPNEDDGEGTA